MSELTLAEYGEEVLQIVFEKYPEDASSPSVALVYTIDSMYRSKLSVDKAAASILRILDVAKGVKNQ